MLTRRPPFTSCVSSHRRCVVPKAVKLYTNPASRGQIVEWYLKELGLEADLVNLDLKEKQHKTPEFIKVNPFGKVPALEDDGLALFESGALLTYLADKYGGLSTPEARAKASQWVLFANSTLANAAFVEQFRERAFPDVMGSLDKVLAEREFLEGGKFSVSDVAVGAYLLYIPAFLPQPPTNPELMRNINAAVPLSSDVQQSSGSSRGIRQGRMIRRMSARPACAATVAARAQQRKSEEEVAAANTQ
eukprot:gene2746-3040_t